MLQELIELFEAEMENDPDYIPNHRLPDGVARVAEQDDGSGRWLSYHRVIVRYKGQLYSVGYSLGLTEYQGDEFYPTVYNIYPVKHTVETVLRHVYTKDFD